MEEPDPVLGNEMCNVENNEGNVKTVDIIYRALKKEIISEDDQEAILGLDMVPRAEWTRELISPIQELRMEDFDILAEDTDYDPRVEEIKEKVNGMYDNVYKILEQTESENEDTDIEDLAAKISNMRNRIYNRREIESESESESESEENLGQKQRVEQVAKSSKRVRKKTEKAQALEEANKKKARPSKADPRSKIQRRSSSRAKLPSSKAAAAAKEKPPSKKTTPAKKKSPAKKKTQPKKKLPAKTKAQPKKKSPAKTKAQPKKKSINMKNGKKKRSVKSRPYSIACVKDQTVRLKFEVCARHIKQLQYCNTFEKKATRNFWPKSQHMMITYDELVQKPRLSSNGDPPKRPKPLTFILPPQGLDVKEFGKMLQKIGKVMEKGGKTVGHGYQLADSLEQYSNWVFGERESNEESEEEDSD